MKDLRDNALPITAIVAVVVFAMGIAWTGSQWKAALDANTDAVRRLAEQIAQTWTWEDHENWAALLKTLNPSLQMPPPVRRPGGEGG